MPESVIDAVAANLRESNANLGAAFAASRRSDELVERAHATAARFLGCRAGETMFGQNMTTLSFALTRTLGRTLAAGDEILVTRLDHDGNVSPGSTSPRTSTSESASSRSTRTRPRPRRPRPEADRTHAGGRLSACRERRGHDDRRGTHRRARARSGALAWADAVHYAPHGPIDVAALGVDVLLCSPYKFFGGVPGGQLPSGLAEAATPVLLHGQVVGSARSSSAGTRGRWPPIPHLIGGVRLVHFGSYCCTSPTTPLSRHTFENVQVIGRKCTMCTPFVRSCSGIGLTEVHLGRCTLRPGDLHQSPACQRPGAGRDPGLRERVAEPGELVRHRLASARPLLCSS